MRARLFSHAGGRCPAPHASASRAVAHPACRRGRLGRAARAGVAFALLTLLGVTPNARAADAAAANAQQTFATPEDAANAFVAALDAGTDAGYRALFGPEIDRLAQSDRTAGEEDQERLREAAKESLVLQPAGDGAVTLVLGAKRWPLPIPLVRKDGSWRFDTPAGIDELLSRRIGANELAAIDLARTYVAAQRAFASEDRDGDDVPEYARSFASAPGKHNGLYWESAPGEPQSPFGPFVAAAGDYAKDRKPGDPFKGYYYRVLERQGPHAAGGAHGYVINGHMIAGFALVAFPADYGRSGIMTFVVGPQGKVFEKDLGPKTAQLAAAMTAYDPDASWKPVAAGE